MINTSEMAAAQLSSGAGERVMLSGYSDQDKNGIDLFHLRANLRLTPTERLERNRKSHELLMEVRRAGAAAGLRRDTGRS